MEISTLTPNQEQQVRTAAIETKRQQLVATKPDPANYRLHESPGDRYIRQILMYSILLIPLIALLASLASAVRTAQAAAEIYRASGASDLAVMFVSIAFPLSTEFAIFLMALAQENEQLRLRRDGAPRSVTSLKSIWHGIQVRIGTRDPLPYDQVKHELDLKGLMWIALVFAVASNAYIGLRPLLAEVGAQSLQDFVRGLWSAPAELQMTFIVDAAAVLFPPFMALKAGHVTARYAAERVEANREQQAAYERDLITWREAYNNPLKTEDGRELLKQFREKRIQEKVRRAEARKANGRPRTTEDTPLGAQAVGS